jgi:hypothetical protein
MIFSAFCVLALAGGLGLFSQTLLAPDDADDDAAESAARAPARVMLRDGVTVLTLHAAMQQRGGIETAVAGSPPSQETVFAYGSVLDTGALTDLANKYLEAQAQVQSADAKLTVSRTAFERAKALYRNQNSISLAQLQTAEGTFVVDQAALVAAQSRVAMLAANALQAWGPLIGEALIARSPLAMQFIEQREYLVRVTLPPGVSPTAPPETATAGLAGGAAIPLRFLSPAPTTNPKLQGVSFFYSAAAKAGALPGLNLNVTLRVKVVERGAVVPESSVVWLQGKAWIYLRIAPDTFTRREIAAHHPGPDQGYVVPGLPPDAQIVVRGAQMLLSEEFRAQVPVED